MILPMTESRLWLFLSTPSVRRATCAGAHIDFRAEISIHALREEGDMGMRVVFRGRAKFLSTPSVRRATRRRLQ